MAVDARRWVLATAMLSVGLVGLAGCAAVDDAPVPVAAAMPLDPYVTPSDAPPPPSTPEEAVAARSATENAVAACMAERGFHYVPYVPAGTGGEFARASRAWSERWGYGVVTQFDAPTSDPDPNQAIRNGLSAADQTAWDAALDGTLQTVQAEPFGPLPSTAAEPQIAAQPSVTTEWAPGTALSEPRAPGAEATDTAPVSSTQGSAEVVFDLQADADAAASAAAAAQPSAEAAVPVPASITAAGPVEVTAWATAEVVPGPDGMPIDGGAAVLPVPASGVPATTRASDGCRLQAENAGSTWVAYAPLGGGADPWSARTLLSEQVAADPAVVAATAAWSRCLADAGYPGMAAPPDPVTSIVTALNGVPFTGSGPDPAALEDLRTREIALALADHDCRETSGLTAARSDAQRRLEQEYVDAHQAELEPYREAVNGGG